MRKLFLGRLTFRTATLVLIEHWLIVLAVTAATILRFDLGSVAAEMTSGSLLWRASLIAAVLQVALHYCDLYDLRTLSDRRDLVVGLIQALGGASLVLAVVYYWLPQVIIGRGVFVIASVFVIVLVAGWRLAFEWCALRVGPAERLLIVGTGAAAVALAKELFDRRQELGVELVGFVDADPTLVGTSLINPGVVGTIEQIPSIVRDRKVDRVVVSLADARGKLPMDGLLSMKLNDGVQFDHLASVYEEYTGKIAVENLRPSWLIFSEGFRKGHILALSKQGLDIIAAALGLAILAPVMALVAIAIRLTSPGAALYSQRRVGKDGHIFVIYKFRSMRTDAEARTGAVWSTENDPRVTPIGRILRRTRLDEVPQLWNVLVGDMSIVGPRPERPEFVADLTTQIPFYGQRHVVRPGVTGWAQVRHSYGSTVEDALQKLQFDLFYIKHLSIAFDLFICLETLKTVLVRRGLVARGAAMPLLLSQDDAIAPVHSLYDDVNAVTVGGALGLVNAMTVDVEDYFQVSAFDRTVPHASWDSRESRVCRNTERLLDLFAGANIKATFFVLGWVAERFPGLVRRIVSEGHELASHGFAHRLVYAQTSREFREDIRSARAALESAGGCRVYGYRAPSYSIVRESLWALDVLIEEGYVYDSSIYPVRHDRYGIPDWPREVHRVQRLGGSIWELPGSTIRVAGTNLPIGGGGYFRLLPYGWTRHGIRRLNAANQPAIFYLHPWEIDPEQPRIAAGRLSTFRHYRNLALTEGRLRRLIAEFPFGRVTDVLAGAAQGELYSSPL